MDNPNFNPRPIFKPYRLLRGLRAVLAESDAVPQARALFARLEAERLPRSLDRKLQRLCWAMERLDEPGGALGAASAAWALQNALLSLGGRCLRAAP